MPQSSEARSAELEMLLARIASRDYSVGIGGHGLRRLTARTSGTQCWIPNGLVSTSTKLVSPCSIGRKRIYTHFEWATCGCTWRWAL